MPPASLKLENSVGEPLAHRRRLRLDVDAQDVVGLVVAEGARACLGRWLKMSVHFVAVGMMKNVYEPAATGLPSMTTSLLKLILVGLLAPARQTLSYGTTVPQILRFLTPGLE